MSKLIITASEGHALIVGAAESRKVLLVVEFEGACPTVLGQKKVERIRTEDGRWVKASTVIRRLEALGGKLLKFEIGGAGEHSPIY